MREIVARHPVEIARRIAIPAYVVGMPTTAIAIPPIAGPRMAPPWLTLLRVETPRAASSRGTTCASRAVRAGRSKPLATPVAKITARIPSRDSAPAADSAASTTAVKVTIALVATTIVRRSRRSARCPPKSTRDRAGIASTSPSQPRASGSRVIPAQARCEHSSSSIGRIA